MKVSQTRTSPTYPRVHLIGIGGIGISALARWFLAQKWVVTGSDLARSPITADLQKEGVNVKIGHRSSNLPKRPDLVVYSPAILSKNPELRLAHRLGVPALSYPEALGRLTRTYTTVAVAGSHGKSTTTALLSLILASAGKDPTVVVGTKLKELGDKNFRSGGGDLLVIEADEWRASFLHHSPTISVVTNIDKEHLDYYKNVTHLKKTFLMFLNRTLEAGALVLNRDDKNLYSLRPAIQKIARMKKLKVLWCSLRQPIARRIMKTIKIPGKHNVSNALLALSAARLLRIPAQTALRAISTYRGSWRRFEYRGKTGLGFDIYDDYAHHPTEIRATLRAFKERFGMRPLVCVYQPHQAKRLAALFSEFKTAFNDADIALILPTYEVAGRDVHRSKLDSEALVRTIQREQSKKRVFYLTQPKNLKKALAVLIPSLQPITSNLQPVLIMMGAGDIVRHTDSLIRK